MEAPPLPPQPRPSNKVTEARHRRETLLQVYLPLMLGMVAFLVAAVLTVLGSFGDVLNNSVLADTIVVWFSIPLLLIGLILFVLVAALAYGVGRLIDIMPPYLKQGQDFSHTVMQRTRRASDSAAEPIVATSSRAAAVRTIIDGVQDSTRRES